VDDGAALLRGHGGEEAGVDVLDHRELARLRLLPLAVPALELAGEVLLAAAEVAEAHGVDVHRVDAGQHVHDRAAGGGPLLVGEAASEVTVADHLPLHEVHHVEGRAVHGLVGAQPACPGDRDVRRAEGRHDGVLAAHVVGGGQHVAERRSPQHPGRAGAILHAVGQVGVTAGDQVERQRRHRLGDVLGEPRGHPLGVDTLDLVAHVPRSRSRPATRPTYRECRPRPRR